MQVLGIDLGTTNTAAAVDGQVFCVRADGLRTLPSVVAFLPNGGVQTGMPARRRRAIDPENTIYSAKRIIGRRWDELETRSFRRLYPLRLVEDTRGMPAFETRAGTFTPTQIAGLLLGTVRACTETLRTGLEVRITVPAAFGEAQRRATLEAAALAGFRDARLLDEPLATAHAYLSPPREVSRAVVYDMGGGTFDCAVVDCRDGAPRMVAHAGDAFLGGDDIDQRIAAWVAREVLEKHHWDLTNYAEIWHRLLLRCEEAKIQLSHGESAVVYLSQVDPECPAAAEGVPLSRGVLDRLCEDLVQRSFVTCDAVLHRAGVRPQEIDAVFLAGGTTHMPVIRRGVEAYFGRPGLLEFEPTEVVAVGAST
jgi:molecular chaperone DnaK